MKFALFASVLALSTASFAKPVVIQTISFMGEENKPMLAKIIADEDTSTSKLAIFDAVSGKVKPVLVVDNLELPMKQYPAFAPKILTINKQKSLEINLGNEHLGIGRHVYSTKLTVAFRQSAYRLVGFSHTSIDKLYPESFQSCDYNLLRGRGVKNGRSLKLSTPATRIELVKPEETIDCNGIK